MKYEKKYTQRYIMEDNLEKNSYLTLDPKFVLEQANFIEHNLPKNTSLRTRVLIACTMLMIANTYNSK